MVWRVGAAAGGGGPVLTASLGTGALVGSHCIIILQHYLDTIHDCPARLWSPPSVDERRSGRHRRRRAARTQKKKVVAEVVEDKAAVAV